MSVIGPGIYFGLPEDEYHAAPALSCSGMKQLAVSPLKYWHYNINPVRVSAEETYPQRLGKAAHCRMLEPARFAETYVAELSPADIPGVLVTTDDLEKFLVQNELPKSGKRKQDLIDRIIEHELDAVIWDVEKERHARLNAGKVLLPKDEAARIEALAAVVLRDPYAKALLSGGVPEVSLFVQDPETGVLLKARLDYLKPAATIDLKTFSNSRGKPTEKAVFDAIFYESYYLQCVVYHTIRELARQQLAEGSIQVHGEAPANWSEEFVGQEQHGFGFVFVESDEPFDLRIIQLKRSEAPGADMNVYWMAALGRMVELTRLYAECREKYGESPWREPCKPHVLVDTDLPQLMFS